MSEMLHGVALVAGARVRDARAASCAPSRSPRATIPDRAARASSASPGPAAPPSSRRRRPPDRWCRATSTSRADAPGLGLRCRARRDAQPHLVRLAGALEAARRAARRRRSGRVRSSQRRDADQRAGARRRSSPASRPRATAPGPAYEICPSPIQPSNWPTDTFSVSGRGRPAAAVDADAIAAEIGRRARG